MKNGDILDLPQVNIHFIKFYAWCLGKIANLALFSV